MKTFLQPADAACRDGANAAGTPLLAATALAATALAAATAAAAMLPATTPATATVAGAAVRGPSAPATEAALPWQWTRSAAPATPVPLAFGPAVAADGATLWIGPARDDDIGDGPPQAASLEVGAGPGLPVHRAAEVPHPLGDRGAGFGRSIAAEGGMALIGSPDAGCGAGGCDMGQAHLATRERDGSWSLAEVACPSPRERSEFGGAVALHGTLLVVASPREGSQAWDAGAVDLYEAVPPHRGSVAPVPTIRHVARLRAPVPNPGGRFGTAVAAAGDRIAIGEPGAGGDVPSSGAVHLARRLPSGWAIEASLRAPAGDGGWFGASLALAGDDLLVGSPIARAPDGTRAGTVAHYSFRDGRWTLRRILRPPLPEAGMGFGMAVAMQDGWIAVGAPGDDAEGEDAGAAFVADMRSGRVRRLLAPSRAAGSGLGAGVGFGAGSGWAPDGPTRFLAVSFRRDPELEPVPGVVELFGFREPEPVLLAAPASQPGAAPQSAGPQSRSASAIASAADASVTGAGRQPDSSSRASASGP
jgi:hypothetical protein